MQGIRISFLSIRSLSKSVPVPRLSGHCRTTYWNLLPCACGWRQAAVQDEIERLQAAAYWPRSRYIEVHARTALFRNRRRDCGHAQIVELNIGHFLIGASVFLGLPDAMADAPLHAGRARINRRAFMILGIGNDLIDIRRIQKTLERYGDRFVQRIFTSEEQARSERRRLHAASYAKRFAAKEACSKALGTGLRQGVFWRDMGSAICRRQAHHALSNGALHRLEKFTDGMRAQIDLTITDDLHWRSYCHHLAVPSIGDSVRQRTRNRERQSQAKNALRENVKTFIWAAIIAVLIRSLLFQPFNIPSSSMKPTLLSVISLCNQI